MTQDETKTPLTLENDHLARLRAIRRQLNQIQGSECTPTIMDHIAINASLIEIAERRREQLEAENSITFHQMLLHPTTATRRTTSSRATPPCAALSTPPIT